MNEQNERQTAGPGNRESFRDSLGIVSTEGKRRWLYPQKPKGGFHRARVGVSVLLLAVLFGVPFVRVDGHPFFLFQVIDRRLILFGNAFGPHDFYLVALVVITLIVFLILFTVVFGRLFCGWICPQTVFMEMVFRKVDYWIEGDHRRQRRLDGMPWNREKLLRKGAKFAIYGVISFLIANALLAYVIGTEALGRLVTEPPARHLGAFGAVIGFSLPFYWIFIWFREQACILICPYGRLQGVLLDRTSVVIAYDHVRGEPRGKFRRNRPTAEGDCIDCHQCVDVCPTGIDIRNGTQLECVNCTACIDACDTVMDAVEKPRGLVRYASAESISGRRGFHWSGRVVGYTVVLLLLAAVLTYLLAVRTELDVTVLRTPGMFYQEQPGGRISNVYDLKIMNKTFGEVNVDVRLMHPAGEVQVIGELLRIGPQDIREGKLLVLLPAESLHVMSTPLSLGIYHDTTLVQEVHTTFLGPVRKR
jgi:cytochrome c oxidase accessory protein FixG